MAVKRDLKKEERALSTFTSNYKKLPSTQEDWNNLHKLAYPDAEGGLPEEFKSALGGAMGASGLSAPGASANLTPAAPAPLIDTLFANKNAAAANMDKTAAPNAFLEVLQNAIRVKAGTENRGVGESDLFKSLGVQGMGALGQSIAAQNNKLASDATNFQNAIGTMAGTYKDMATMAKVKYDQAYTQWKDEADRLQKVQDNLQQHKDAIDTLQQQYQNSLKLEQWKRNNPDLADIIKANEAGIDPVTGKPLTSNEGSVSFRTNNPGNIKWGEYAKSLGAVDSGIQATDGGTFAKFPDLKAGTEAQKKLLQGSGYINLTLDQAMKRWSNNGYGAEIEPSIPATTLMKDLTPVQLDTLAQSQQRAEGFSAPSSAKIITPAQTMAAKTLAVKLWGVRAGGDPKNIKLITDQLAAGVSIDDIGDNLRLSNFSTAFNGSFKDAVESLVTSGLTKDQQTNLENSIDRRLQSGKPEDIKSATELLMKTAKDTADTTTTKTITGQERTVQFLNEIAGDLKAYEDKGGKTNIFNGTQSEIENKVGATSDPELRTIANKISLALFKYRNNMSGVAFGTKENEQYKKLFPDISKTSKLNTANLNALNDAWSGDVKYFYENQLGSKAYENIVDPYLKSKQTGTSSSVDSKGRPPLTNFEKP